MLNTALALSQMRSDWQLGQTNNLSPMLVMIVRRWLHRARLCVMDSLAMILLTIPIFTRRPWGWSSQHGGDGQVCVVRYPGADGGQWTGAPTGLA